MKLLHSITLPVQIERPKSKTYKLNLNIFRNAHYKTNNGMKVKYLEMLTSVYKDIPPIKKDKLLFKYKYYHGDRRKLDVANVVSIIDKFNCDSMISLGLLEEDNYTILPAVLYEFGGIRKGEPSCDLFIYEYSHPYTIELSEPFICE